MKLTPFLAVLGRRRLAGQRRSGHQGKVHSDPCFSFKPMDKVF